MASEEMTETCKGPYDMNLVVSDVSDGEQFEFFW
jgi:hypothetical protein